MSSKSEIKLSVAIVTRNRPDSLFETIDSLSRQSVQPYEIVISDDSNQEELILRNKKIAEKFGGHYFTGPQNGLYANRNFVAKKCTGTHFRTMDDDHFFPEDHLKNCINAIEMEPRTIWTLGEYYPRTKHMTLPPPIPGQLHPRGFSIVPVNMNEYFGISCGGTIYPAEVIKEKIFNCEIYKFGSTFLEYGARLKSKGFRIKFLADTYFVHNDTETTGSEISYRKLREARLFSMLCYSFEYQKTWKNQIQTLAQISYDILMGRYSFSEVSRAYRNFRVYPKN
ncbi:glycosyltransferase family 2 protein [Christiangramia echinicola]|uniref:glycosyltransferase family 2 protein n=1 Tax=Christiangramia echinicola TaxID=279359 RepID=UPI00041DDF7D|nr:glycosyltransferase family 2 protein [Christiangramia echinicola]